MVVVCVCCVCVVGCAWGVVNGGGEARMYVREDDSVLRFRAWVCVCVGGVRVASRLGTKPPTLRPLSLSLSLSQKKKKNCAQTFTPAPPSYALPPLRTFDGPSQGLHLHGSRRCSRNHLQHQHRSQVSVLRARGVNRTPDPFTRPPEELLHDGYSFRSSSEELLYCYSLRSYSFRSSWERTPPSLLASLVLTSLCPSPQHLFYY